MTTMAEHTPFLVIFPGCADLRTAAAAWTGPT